jgi:hypothetical protein
MSYYNGQSPAEFEKNYQRVKDIVAKSLGDSNKEERLAIQQAKLIKDEWKAINRAMAAKELGYMNIYEVFFRKAYELGSVPTQEFRDYILSKLLEE